MQKMSYAIVQMLEARRLRSATIVGSQLSITGTSKDDGIVVSLHKNDHSKIDVSVRHVVSTFAVAGISRITIQGFAGDDKILISETNGAISIPCVIYGGAGNDSIVAGSGRDHIFGEAGDDSLFGGANRDVIRGEAGDDSINGDAGADSILGGDGNDSIDGDDGNDTVHGEFGDDSLLGGNGRDHVFGDDGNDFCEGDAGDDSVFGGHGADDFGPDDRSVDRKDADHNDTQEDANDDHGNGM